MRPDWNSQEGGLNETTCTRMDHFRERVNRGGATLFFFFFFKFETGQHILVDLDTQKKKV